MNEMVIPVLGGSVEYVDHMGTDMCIVDAARVSYGKKAKRLRDDGVLLRYLMRQKHYSVFAQVVLKIRFEAPIFSARQIFRTNETKPSELSGRYAAPIETVYTPQADEWRLQSKMNKQGSDGRLDAESGAVLTAALTEVDRAEAQFRKMAAEFGVATEMTRSRISVSQHTAWFLTANVGTWLRLCSQRLHHTAQWETRQFAEGVAQIVERLFPLTWAAFVDYQLESETFSRMELAGLRSVLSHVLNDAGVDAAVAASGLVDREALEFRAKLRGLADGG